MDDEKVPLLPGVIQLSLWLLFVVCCLVSWSSLLICCGVIERGAAVDDPLLVSTPIGHPILH